MKRTELPECPHWLAECECENENVEWYDNRPGTWIVWHGGDWYGGDWYGGDWYGGDWHGGDWHGGVWHGGVWHGGVWHGGRTSIRTKWPVILEENGSISIGCKTKTRDEWEAWFAGTEAYSTPRDTEAFRQIHGAYRGLIAWMDTVNPPAITAPKVKAVRKRKAGA